MLFTGATAPLAALAEAEPEGQLAVELTFYATPELLVIDELGPLPFERRGARLFFQPAAQRYERGSTLITTNQAVTQWGHVFGDEVLAALVITGESYGLEQKKKAGLLGGTHTTK